MILFLLVTSIVNIALGYALAVYFGRASTEASETAPTQQMPTADVSLPRPEMTPEELVSDTASNESPQPCADEAEHELLAGINDFRHQLAQLRGQADGGPVLDSLAIGASS